MMSKHQSTYSIFVVCFACSEIANIMLAECALTAHQSTILLGSLLFQWKIVHFMNLEMEAAL